MCFVKINSWVSHTRAEQLKWRFERYLKCGNAAKVTRISLSGPVTLGKVCFIQTEDQDKTFLRKALRSYASAFSNQDRLFYQQVWSLGLALAYFSNYCLCFLVLV